MAIIKCPECGHDVSDQAYACPQCGYPIQKIKSDETAEAPAPATEQPKKKGRAVATIITVSLLLIALAVGGAWFLFMRGSSDGDERTAFDNITRFEREGKLDSLEVALNAYFDTFNPDSYHFNQLKELNDRFFAERSDWQAVEGLSSVEAVHRFLDKHPDGFYREKANNQLDSLSFAEAVKEDTKEAYELYIAQFSDGKFVSAAQEKLSGIDKKQLSVEEIADVRSVLSQHFDALANNDKATIALTLAHTINSYIGKNDATEEDIFNYMDHIHQSGRTLMFTVQNSQVSKVEAGNKIVYNVQFSLDEATFAGSVSHEDTDDAAAVPSNVKHFTGTAVLNQAMKITSLVLKN